MLFNSIEFAIFLPIVFLLYWFVFAKNLGMQNLLILSASYIFYGWWDWRFLFLIIFSSLTDYIVGLRLQKVEECGKRRLLLALSISVNVGLLGFFKYYNFFVNSFVEAFTLFGFPFQIASLDIVLPVGISFYTFQTLSYSIDIYKNKIRATKNIVEFFAFVAFFPQLVAGPIERAANLLPQFSKKRKFEYDMAVDGLRQILWGLFKKVVIADNCAIYVNDIFANYQIYSGMTLILGGIFFAFQIYGDFSGYSDIAIGTSRLFGFDLMRNFAFPYFSRDVAEFWRRWHISLTTWFRDYVYIPLGGSKCETPKKIRNTLIIFILSGFWHGANWTFIAWGALNALYFLPLLVLNKNRNHMGDVAKGGIVPGMKELLQMAFTFFLTVVAWVFFRAENIWIALDYLWHAFINFYSVPSHALMLLQKPILVFILLMLLVEWVQRDKKHALEQSSCKIPKVVRWTAYYVLTALIISYGGTKQEFIYFQF